MVAIVLDTLDDGEEVTHAVVCVRGKVHPLAAVCGRDVVCRHLRIVKEPHEDKLEKLAKRPLSAMGTFSFLLNLSQGDNVISIQCGPTSKQVSVHYRRHLQLNHFVRLIYITYEGDEGHFQAPEGHHRDVSSACRRLSVAGSLVQCFLGHSLKEAGLGRKTITFNQWQMDKELPDVHIHRSRVPIATARTLKGHELWTIHAHELVEAGLTGKQTKVLAMTSATRLY